MQDIMIDLETESTKTTANILSIGAVRFNINTGELGDKFYINVNPDKGRELGLHVDPDTLHWWSIQSQSAIDALLIDQVPIDLALNKLSSFISIDEDSRLWGNGSAFDNAILRNAYDVCNISIPWRFYNDLDYRTLKLLYFEADGINPKGVLPFEGVQHNALDDAIYQVKSFKYMYDFLKVKNFKI